MMVEASGIDVITPCKVTRVTGEAASCICHQGLRKKAGC